MARNFPNNVANYLFYADGVTNSTPVIPTNPTTYTISGWGRPTTLGQFSTLYGQADGFGGAGYLSLDLDAGNHAVLASKSSGVAAADAVSSTTASINTWHHLCGVQSGLTLRTVYLDGGNPGTSTASQTPGTTNAAIGVHWFGTGAGGGNFFNAWPGDIAEVAVWSDALSAAEVAILALGTSPLLVRPATLLGYWPLIGRYSAEIDPRRAQPMQIAGTVAQAAHPRVLQPGRRGMTGVGSLPVLATATGAALLPAM